MTSTRSSLTLADRVIGGALVAVFAMVILLFWNTWELTLPVRGGISAGLGFCFALFGGNIMAWLRAIDFWS